MTTARLAEFIAARARETYPEQQSNGHDSVVASMAPKVAAMIPAGGDVLDVGSGYGTALDWFTENGFEAYGIDVNEENIRSCLDKGHLVAKCDMHDLEGYEDGQFALVWARHVLEHSIAPFFVLSEFFRILKPGAILYVEVPSPDTACHHEGNKNHYSVFGDHLWIHLFKKAGFDCVESMEAKFMTQAGPDRYAMFICRKPNQP